MRICAVIPCRDEEKMVWEVVVKAKKCVDEVFVVDDGSSDKTAEAAREVGAVVVSLRGKMGVGKATEAGFKEMMRNGYEAVITLDGDGQHDADEIFMVAQPILKGEADVVIGSRFLGDYELPMYRKFGIDVITWFYNFGCRERISDGQSCFRAYNWTAIQKLLPVLESGFSFSVETLVKARVNGLRIKEVPIACIYHGKLTDDSALNPFRHGLGVLFGTAKWRLCLEAGVIARHFVFWLLKTAARPLAGRGLKLRCLRRLYSRLTRVAMPKSGRIIRVNDFMMRLNRGLDGMTGSLVARGCYEPITTRLASNILRPGMRVVDVGAHVGYYTLLFSKLVGEGVVWAFEPEQANFGELESNISLNSLTNVVAVNKAVSDRNGYAALYISPFESGEHSLVRGRPYIKDMARVEVIALDDFINGEVDLIKTDTEGGEIGVLRGARNLIMSSKDVRIICEVWKPGLEASGYCLYDLWKLLKSYDFSYYFILDDTHGWVFAGTAEDTYTKAVERCGKSNISVNLFCSRSKM